MQYTYREILFIGDLLVNFIIQKIFTICFLNNEKFGIINTNRYFFAVFDIFRRHFIIFGRMQVNER